MQQLVNLDEVLVMAVQIEHNAARFYRDIARRHGDGLSGEVLEKLASMEDGHEHVFRDMRETVNQQSTSVASDLSAEGGLYLWAVSAGGYRVEGSQGVLDSLSGDETIEDILKIGLDLEKESVLYYLGIRDIVPSQEAKDTISKVIEQEKEHIVVFADMLRERQ